MLDEKTLTISSNSASFIIGLLIATHETNTNPAVKKQCMDVMLEIFDSDAKRVEILLSTLQKHRYDADLQQKHKNFLKDGS